MSKATTFYDMSSGGLSKEDFKVVVIEAPLEEAKSIFYAKFGHGPDRVSCTCCGEDYSSDEHETLEEATAYWDRHVLKSLQKVITKDEISDEERNTSIPEEGFVWK